MRYFRERLRRIPTLYLAICVAAIDVVVIGAGVPFELCCRRAVTQHANDSGMLIVLLLGNLALLALVIAGMCASTLLMGRGAFSLTRLVRRRVPAAVPVRSRRSGY